MGLTWYTDGMQDMLTRALSIARLTMTFGQVRRVTLHEDGERESDTTHTVMLTLLSVEVAQHIGCDPGLTAQFATIHDFPEVYAGDTNTARGLAPDEAKAKAVREAESMRQIAVDLGDSPWVALMNRYEAQVEPEARLVRYLDKVLPKLTHYWNRGAALRALGLTGNELRGKHARQGAQLAAQYPEMNAVGRLFADACALVEHGIASGEDAS